MGLTNIKAKNQGFTIVELLIVVVVIAILAAITIVSYNGITNRANASASAATAGTWQKKLELYNSETSSYPTTKANLSGDAAKSYYIDTTNMGVPTKDNGKTTVNAKSCVTPAGASIDYWQYDKATPGITTIYIGGASSSSTCTPLT